MLRHLIIFLWLTGINKYNSSPLMQIQTYRVMELPGDVCFIKTTVPSMKLLVHTERTVDTSRCSESLNLAEFSGLMGCSLFPCLSSLHFTPQGRSVTKAIRLVWLKQLSNYETELSFQKFNTRPNCER
jgi:hypothetical protein